MNIDSTKKGLFKEWYEEYSMRYAEAILDRVASLWEEEFGNDQPQWLEFHELYKNLKVKFYYEDEE